MCVSSPCLNNNSKPTHREGGTVLVLVLLIVALVAGLSVKFAAQYQLGLARAEPAGTVRRRVRSWRGRKRLPS